MAVTTLGLVDGLPVAIAAGRDTTVVEWLDPGTGSPAGRMAVLGEVRGIAGIPGTRRFVLDLERGGSRDLWLFELP